MELGLAEFRLAPHSDIATYPKIVSPDVVYES